MNESENSQLKRKLKRKLMTPENNKVVSVSYWLEKAKE